MKELWKKLNLARIDWLKSHGSIYFPFWDMVFKYPLLMLFNGILTVKSTIFNSPVIHVIGDSHAKPFIYRFPFLIHHISQATAYNLVKENSYSQSNKYLKLFLSKIDKRRDIVLLIFGEIDARVHIYLRYGKSGGKVSIDTLVDKTVERYGQIINQIREKGYIVYVHGIPPAASKYFVTTLPFTGKPWERSAISRTFNEKLKVYCESIYVPYIDIHLIAADENGFIKRDYLADEVHCNSRIVPFTRDIIITAFNSKQSNI